MFLSLEAPRVRDCAITGAEEDIGRTTSGCISTRSLKAAGRRRRSRQEGAQEHDARDATQGAAGGSGGAQKKKQRIEREEAEGTKESDPASAASDTEWTTYEFDRGIR